MTSLYDFNVDTIDGKTISLDTYKGKVLLIVNTASKCGFTAQYEQLQALYEAFSDQPFEILAFPCNQFGAQEPGDAEEIKSFCSLTYDVTFPLFAKVDVRGETAHPLFAYLSEAKPFKGLDLSHPIGERLTEALENNFPEFLLGNGIKWNFTKFLIAKDGDVVERFEPTTEPQSLSAQIEALF